MDVIAGLVPCEGKPDFDYKTDLFNMWVWFESMAISSYLLVAYHRQREDALGASTKYFIQTVSGSILVLFGILSGSQAAGKPVSPALFTSITSLLTHCVLFRRDGFGLLSGRMVCAKTPFWERPKSISRIRPSDWSRHTFPGLISKCMTLHLWR